MVHAAFGLEAVVPCSCDESSVASNVTQLLACSFSSRLARRGVAKALQPTTPNLGLDFFKPHVLILTGVLLHLLSSVSAAAAKLQVHLRAPPHPVRNSRGHMQSLWLRTSCWLEVLNPAAVCQREAVHCVPLSCTFEEPFVCGSRKCSHAVCVVCFLGTQPPD